MSASFGPTCAGRARTAAAALLFLSGLLIVALPNAAFAATTTTTETTTTATAITTTSTSGVGATSPATLSLGFTPSSVSPVTNGVPVYTVGDTIWAQASPSSSSASNQAVSFSVASPGTAGGQKGVVATGTLAPGAVSPLYTFKASDADGVWNITTTSQSGGTVVTPFHFVNPSTKPVSLGPLAYSLEGSNLSISTQASLGSSYDQEVCAAGSTPLAGVTLGLPASMDERGNVTLVPGNALTIETVGMVNESFSFWIELYHPYALDVASANSLVVNELLAASSQPVAFVSNSTASTSLTWNTGMRDGRYDMRAYFQNSTSLDVVQSRVLILNNASWVSLSNECLPQTIRSQSISYSDSLAGGPANWPTTLYVMYRDFGVEGVASMPVRANLSSVDFVASPWNQTLPGLKVNVSPSPAVIQTGQAGNSLFVLASQSGGVQVNYSLDLNGGHGVAQGSVNVANFANRQVKVALAKLTVNVLSDQISPTTLVLTGPQGVNIDFGLTGSNQTTSFLLPTGTYMVSGSQAGNSQSAQVALTDGAASSVTLNFNTLMSFEIILVVTAALAAIANVFIWVLRSRSLSSKMTSSRDSSKM